MRARRALPAALAALLLLGAAAGCSQTESAGAEGGTEQVADQAGPAPGLPSAEAALAEGRTVVDVRTPEEFAEGHVEGAELIDVQDPAFADRIAELDPAGAYVVYCRSGSRSAAAAEQMRAAGLDVLDGGGLPTMLEAGWPGT